MFGSRGKEGREVCKNCYQRFQCGMKNRPNFDLSQPGYLSASDMRNHPQQACFYYVCPTMAREARVLYRKEGEGVDRMAIGSGHKPHYSGRGFSGRWMAGNEHSHFSPGEIFVIRKGREVKIRSSVVGYLNR